MPHAKPQRRKADRLDNDVSVELERPPLVAATGHNETGGLDLSPTLAPACTLAQLPLGARLILRCRKDWRMAAVAYVAPDCVMLAVCSPSGHTYRVRRPVDAPLTFEGHIPILGDCTRSCWRVGLARYDVRW